MTISPMFLLGLVGLAAALSVNNIVAALGLGLGGIHGRDRLRVFVVFAATSTIAPVIGVVLGGVAAPYVGAGGRIAGGAILIAVAIEGMVRRGQRFRSAKNLRHLVAIGVAVNLDSLVSGLALGVNQVPVMASIVLIAVVPTGLSMVALEVGGRFGGLLQKRGEPAGSVVMVLVGAGMIAGVLK